MRFEEIELWYLSRMFPNHMPLITLGHLLCLMHHLLGTGLWTSRHYPA